MFPKSAVGETTKEREFGVLFFGRQSIGSPGGFNKRTIKKILGLTLNIARCLYYGINRKMSSGTNISDGNCITYIPSRVGSNLISIMIK